MRWLAIACSMLLAACQITLVAPYDEGMDRGITEFSKSTNVFLLQLERTGRAPGPLSRDEAVFFDQATVELTMLRTRAQALDQNTITTKMLENLSMQLGDLQKLIELGVKPGDVPPLRSAFEISTTAILKFELAKKRGPGATKG